MRNNEDLRNYESMPVFEAWKLPVNVFSTRLISIFSGNVFQLSRSLSVHPFLPIICFSLSLSLSLSFWLFRPLTCFPPFIFISLSFSLSLSFSVTFHPVTLQYHSNEFQTRKIVKSKTQGFLYSYGTQCAEPGRFSFPQKLWRMWTIVGFQACWMNLETFYLLHLILEVEIKRIFGSFTGDRPKTNVANSLWDIETLCVTFRYLKCSTILRDSLNSASSRKIGYFSFRLRQLPVTSVVS